MTLKTQAFRYQPTQDDSDSEGEVTAPSRTPSPSLPPASEGFDAAIDELAGVIKTLSIDSSTAAPAATPQRQSLREEIMTKRCPVLLVGESETRALLFTLAVMRGSSKGIRATCFHDNKNAPICLWRRRPPLNIDREIERIRARIKQNNQDRNELELEGM